MRWRRINKGEETTEEKIHEVDELDLQYMEILFEIIRDVAAISFDG